MLIGVFVVLIIKNSLEEYKIEVRIVPRFSGSFTLNPAKAELIYFPTYYGREGMKRIQVK